MVVVFFIFPKASGTVYGLAFLTFWTFKWKRSKQEWARRTNDQFFYHDMMRTLDR